MTRTQKLIDTIARLNPDAGEIGAGMLANIVSEARAIQNDSPQAAAQGVTDEQIAAVFAKYADFGTAHFLGYIETFRHAVRDVLALASPPSPALASGAEPVFYSARKTPQQVIDDYTAHKVASETAAGAVTDATYGNRGECDAPSLKGRAAIVDAWNNLDHATRTLPGLDALYRACMACEDAIPPAATQVPQGIPVRRKPHSQQD
jgi:hypothetical protein